MREYGLLLTRAREAAGLEVADLAAKIGQSEATVRRLEGGRTEPSVRQINKLVAALPLSADQLLLAMGVNLSSPAAGTLPPALIEAASLLDESHMEMLIVTARALVALQQNPEIGTLRVPRRSQP